MSPLRGQHKAAGMFRRRPAHRQSALVLVLILVILVLVVVLVLIIVVLILVVVLVVLRILHSRKALLSQSGTGLVCPPGAGIIHIIGGIKENFWKRLEVSTS